MDKIKVAIFPLFLLILLIGLWYLIFISIEELIADRSFRSYLSFCLSLIAVIGIGTLSDES